MAKAEVDLLELAVEVEVEVKAEGDDLPAIGIHASAQSPHQSASGKNASLSSSCGLRINNSNNNHHRYAAAAHRKGCHLRGGGISNRDISQSSPSFRKRINHLMVFPTSNQFLCTHGLINSCHHHTPLSHVETVIFSLDWI